MIQQAEMTKLGRPNLGDLRFLKRWMKDTDMGNISLLGRDFKSLRRPGLSRPIGYEAMTK